MSTGLSDVASFFICSLSWIELIVAGDWDALEPVLFVDIAYFTGIVLTYYLIFDAVILFNCCSKFGVRIK
jgi:hypothetical protein